MSDRLAEYRGLVTHRATTAESAAAIEALIGMVEAAEARLAVLPSEGWEHEHNREVCDAEHPPTYTVECPCGVVAVYRRVDGAAPPEPERWECNICGYHPDSTSTWCAVGCGRDYTRMVRHRPASSTPTEVERVAADELTALWDGPDYLPNERARIGQAITDWLGVADLRTEHRPAFAWHVAHVENLIDAVLAALSGQQDTERSEP